MTSRYKTIYFFNMKDLEQTIQELESYRLKNRITQQGLARLLGVSFVTVNRWLNGHQVPNKIQAYQIKKLLASKRRIK